MVIGMFRHATAGGRSMLTRLVSGVLGVLRSVLSLCLVTGGIVLAAMAVLVGLFVGGILLGVGIAVGILGRLAASLGRPVRGPKGDRDPIPV